MIEWRTSGSHTVAALAWSIRQCTPQSRILLMRVPLRYDFQTFTTSIIGWPQCDPIRMASMGTSLAARQAG